MNLSERERKIAIFALLAVVLLGLYYFVFTPYANARAELVKSREDLQKQRDEADLIFRRQAKLRPVWASMQAGGLKIDTSEAQKQTYGALLEWARSADVQVATVKFERTTQEGSFQVIGFSVAATGSMPQVSRLLWAMETATIPVRVNEVQVTPRKEGTDDLQVRISVSALCQPPDAPAKPANGDTGAKSS